MKTIFHVQPHELNQNFLSVLKSVTNGHSVKIAVEEMEIEEMDETEYLLSNPANKAHLMSAIENDRKDNMIEMSWQEHNALKKSLELIVANEK